MGFLWKLFKVAVVVAITIPVCLFAFAITAGIVGTLLRLAVLAFRVALLGAIGYVGFKVLKAVFGKPAPATPQVKSLPSVDPYYQAAMRELDAEMGSTQR